LKTILQFIERFLAWLWTRLKAAFDAAKTVELKPQETISDATSAVEEEGVEKARTRLRKSGASERQIAKAEEVVVKRLQANQLALEYLTSITLLNPRDVIRSENMIRIQFGILSRNGVDLSGDLPQKVAKWVMIREFAPALGAWLTEEGIHALTALEAASHGQLTEFMAKNFPDCGEDGAVVTLLLANPKIGSDFDRLRYLRKDPVLPRAKAQRAPAGNSKSKRATSQAKSRQS
jgi:hypothetical protein